MTEEKSNTKKWINFLDPNNLKDKLIFSSLYIATFESFKDYIVEEVKFFFNTGFSSNEFTFSDNYKTAVLLKDKSVLKATIFWLKDCGAIEEKDIETFDELRTYRNKLSHELMELLFDGLSEDLPEKFIQLIKLRIKVEKWWILNIEIPTNSEFNPHTEILEEDIVTSSQMFNHIIFDMLSGDEKKANRYMNEKKNYFEDK